MDILSISIFVENSRLSLVATLKDLSNAEGVSSKLKTLFMTFNPEVFLLMSLPLKTHQYVYW